MNRGEKGSEGLRRSTRKTAYRGQPSDTTLNRETSESGEETVVVHPFTFESEVVRGEEYLQNPESGLQRNLSGRPEPEMARQVTRLRYRRFKGDGSQDVDDWLCEFESTANANQEDRETKLRIFQGMLKGEALKWYRDVPEPVRTDWYQLSNLFLRTFREPGGEARALGRLSKMTMKSGESVRKYSQRVKGLLQKLTTEVAPSVQVEWFMSGFPEEMGFQIRQTRPTTLRDAIEAAQNYENSKQSLRQSLKRGKGGRTKYKSRSRTNRTKYSESEDSSSRSSNTSETSSSGSGSSTPSPKRMPRPRGARRDHDRPLVKVKIEDPEESSRKVMKDIQESLAAIKVNLADNRRPRRMIPTTRANVWCTRCGEAGHYPNECPRMPPKKVQFVDEEGTVYSTTPEYEEEEEGYYPVYQVAPTYGRGKVPQQLFRTGQVPPRPSGLVYPGQHSGTVVPPRRIGTVERQLGLCYVCGEDGHYANMCPRRVSGQGAPLELPCQNCREYGHDEKHCPQPMRVRPIYKPVENPPREQTALNYGHKEGVENPDN